ncbi:hypothetical protein [Cyanobium sp. CH-040]|uniref:hypothetical protein n=1 Tax=Cyanobium sp. CH-040 TaxID=2823708 RepID=UPI0020CFB33A|nr:hypothetical protein [Cyanobium sp. CH-040]MCP9928963.1 hypothetical protein [Cyanobium sp. CH-040]
MGGRSGPDPAQPPPIAIRRALEQGWQAFRQAPGTLILFTLLMGGLIIVFQLTIRFSTANIVNDYGQTDPLAWAVSRLAVVAWILGFLWLVVGLLRGADAVLQNTRPRLRDLLRLEGRALLRTGGTLALELLVLGVIVRLAQASAWLLALLEPPLMALPLLAGIAAVVYVLTDQILSLPLCVLGGRGPLEAFRRGRTAIDPHWLQALGLTLLLGLVVLSGFLLPLVGLAASLPLAACIQVAAYRQLFVSGRQQQLRRRQPQPVQPQRNRP